MAHTSFVWNETYAHNGANGHDRHGKANPLRKNTNPNGGASLLTTATDYATFICALLNAQGLSAETIDQMTSSHVPVTLNRGTADVFANLFWGWGWGVQPGDTGFGFWHWGDNGDLRAYTVTYKDTKNGFVYFSNSNNGLAIAGAVTSLIMDDHQFALDWLDYEKYDDPKRIVGMAIEKAFMDEGIEAGMQKIEEAKETFPELVEEDSLTEMAQYLGSGGKKEAAIALLKACLESYPESADAYTGLGLTYLDTGEFQKATEGFEGSLKMRKDNRLATRGLQWARDALKAAENPVELSTEELEKFAGDYGPRHIFIRDGRLYYQRDGRPEYRLTPLNKNTFALEGYGPFRIRFDSDESGRVTKIVGLYIQGNTDESPRDKN
jgi:tetratricopeptide (TPR) repeat protein